jgi:molecular chaperone GrpE
MPKDGSPPRKKASARKKNLALRVREVDVLRRELESEREKAKDCLNRLMYLQADFENYRKRVNKDLNEATQYGSQRLTAKLLPVVDELEYAVEAGRNVDGNKGLLEGVEMVLKKMCEVLGKEGLSKIDAVGKPFDPDSHEAVEKIPTEEFEEGTVVEEIRKGFLFKDRVIRPTLVKVAVTPKNNSNEKVMRNK